MDKLIVEDLHKKYGTNEVLKGVSLRAREGDVICIIGSSGSGKALFFAASTFWNGLTPADISSMVNRFDCSQTGQGS